MYNDEKKQGGRNYFEEKEDIFGRGRNDGSCSCVCGY